MSRRRTRTPSAAPGPVVLTGTRRALAVVGWSLGLGSVAYGLHRLDPLVHSLADHPTRIEWVGLPDWVQSESWRLVLDDLNSRIDAPEAPLERFDIYADQVCSFIGSQVSASPWVERVERVSKQRDGLVRIHAVFRRPFTMIEWRGRAMLVDQAGVRLPHEEWAANVPRGTWLLIRSAANPPPRIGERWSGEDVVAGLRLAEFLYGSYDDGKLPFWTEIDAIDLGNFTRRQERLRGQLAILLNNGESYIDWGLPVGEEYGVEPPAGHKLMAATTCYRRFGGQFPAHRPIDVRSGEWAEVAEAPVTESGRVP